MFSMNPRLPKMKTHTILQRMHHGTGNQSTSSLPADDNKRQNYSNLLTEELQLRGLDISGLLER
jgi:hypothetical protein